MSCLRDFACGVKVSSPRWNSSDYRSRYSTILYTSYNTVLLRPEFGEDFIMPGDTDDFQYFKLAPTEKLEKLGIDLVSSIEDANWNFHDGQGLTGPTLHMQDAVNNWKRRNNG